VSPSRKRGLGRLTELKQDHVFTAAEMNDQRQRFEQLKGQAAPVVVSSFNLFPTPPDVALRVALMANVHDGHRVLEPSAGTGNLIAAIADANVAVTAVEINADLCWHLRRTFENVGVVDVDFLQWQSPVLFDRVIMNPPFKNGVDRKHIDHALQFLKPGGRLVSVLAAGPRQREWFENHNAKTPNLDCDWLDLPSGSFKCEGTNVETAIVSLRKNKD
jgi:protein-L-isoaspartate O-methyltransferase